MAQRGDRSPVCTGVEATLQARSVASLSWNPNQDVEAGRLPSISAMMVRQLGGPRRGGEGRGVLRCCVVLVVAIVAGCGSPTDEDVSVAVSIVEPDRSDEVPSDTTTTVTTTSEAEAVTSAAEPATNETVEAGDPSTPLGPEASVVDVLAVVGDVHGPTTDLVAELGRVGWVPEIIPAPAAELEIRSFTSGTTYSAILGGPEALSTVAVEVVTTLPVGDAEAAMEAATRDWTFVQTTATPSGDRITLVRAPTDANWTFSWRVDSDATAAVGATVMTLESQLIAETQAEWVDWYATWNPASPIPPEVDLVGSQVTTYPGDGSSVEVQLVAQWELQAGDGDQVALHVAEALGEAGYLAEARDYGTDEAFEVGPTPPLESEVVRVRQPGDDVLVDHTGYATIAIT